MKVHKKKKKKNWTHEGPIERNKKRKKIDRKKEK